MREFLRRLKGRARASRRVWSMLLSFWARAGERSYRKRRERYVGRPAVAPSPRWRAPAAKRSLGDVHTFAVIPSLAWQDDLLPELRLLGPVDRFDYANLVKFKQARGYSAEFLKRRREVNDQMVSAFERAHQERPVDWLFAYAQSDQILASAIQTIRERYGVPCVNMALDDKQSWDAGMVGEQRRGSIGLVATFDLWWTSARVTVDWVNAEGGRAIYLPEGCAPSIHHPTGQPFDIPVSFVGANFGPRPNMVHFPREHRVPVQVFGNGWKSMGGTGWVESPADIFRRSQINLGNRSAMRSERITNLKCRDFDLPCTGGGLYLTTYNADLAQHFRIGEEILCWHSYDEMLELVRYYLPRPDECREMARRARERCLREHRWSHRYIRVLQELGVLGEGVQPPPIDQAAAQTRTA